MRLRVMDLGAAKAGAFTKSRQLLVLDRCGEEVTPEEIEQIRASKPDFMGVEMLVFADEVQIGEDWEQAYQPPLRYVLPSGAGQEGVADAQSALWEPGEVDPESMPQDLDSLRERLRVQALMDDTL